MTTAEPQYIQFVRVTTVGRWKRLIPREDAPPLILLADRIRVEKSPYRPHEINLIERYWWKVRPNLSELRERSTCLDIRNCFEIAPEDWLLIPHPPRPKVIAAE